MKVKMCIWAGGTPNLPSWFKHDEEIDMTFEQLKELYGTGNNVMLYHANGFDSLCVDSKKFTQR